MKKGDRPVPFFVAQGAACAQRLVVELLVEPLAGALAELDVGGADDVSVLLEVEPDVPVPADPEVLPEPMLPELEVLPVPLLEVLLPEPVPLVLGLVAVPLPGVVTVVSSRLEQAVSEASAIKATALAWAIFKAVMADPLGKVAKQFCRSRAGRARP